MTTDLRTHIRGVSDQGYSPDTLCGLSMYTRRALACFEHQVSHAVYAGADICNECRRFYETHRDYFDSIAAHWNETKEAIA